MDNEKNVIQATWTGSNITMALKKCVRHKKVQLTYFDKCRGVNAQTDVARVGRCRRSRLGPQM